MSNPVPNKNQRYLLEILGPEYSMKTIDMEPCIYRKLNDHYDIEISGTYQKRSKFNVYVWDISNGEGPGSRIVDRCTDINGEGELKRVLYNFVAKYQKQS